MPEIVILYTTRPEAEKAEAGGAEAVGERLAAGANDAPARSPASWRCGAVGRGFPALAAAER
jgi:uncharacterized protein involved in tolerance to divalent cations